MSSVEEQITLFLIISSSIKIVLNISLLILYIIRINKLDRMAKNNFFKKPRALTIKVVLLFFLELSLILHILLSYFYEEYWLHPYENFSLVDVSELVLALLQVYIVRKEYKKKAIRAYSVPFAWLFWGLFDLGVIVFIEIIFNVNEHDINTTSSQMTIVLLALKMCILVGLFLTAIAEPKNVHLEEIMDANELLNTNRLGLSPLIPETRRTMNERTSISMADFSGRYASGNANLEGDSGKVYIEFNKEFNIIMKDEQMACEFKFAVFFNQESHIVVRKEQQFLNLVEEMNRLFPEDEDVKIASGSASQGSSSLSAAGAGYSSMMKYGEEKQRVYEEYLIHLTKNDKFYVPLLLDFIDINPVKRIGLTKKRQNDLFGRKESMQSSEDEDRQKRPFFKVDLVNGKIHISNSDILEIILNKSKAEIEKFHKKLVGEKKLKIELLTDAPDMNEIMHFILRAVNSKNTWKSFSEWLHLGKKLSDKIYNMFDFWTYGFKDTSLSIIGHEIAFDNEGSIQTLYLLSIAPRINMTTSMALDSEVNITKKKNITLKKRYNEFVKLDKNVKKFVHSNNIKGPTVALPPKFSPFGTKTSPQSRQIYLDIYINEILKIEEISNYHCIPFLEFLEVDQMVKDKPYTKAMEVVPECLEGRELKMQEGKGKSIQLELDVFGVNEHSEGVENGHKLSDKLELPESHSIYEESEL